MMIDANKAAHRASMNRALPPEFLPGMMAISAEAVIAVDDQQRIIFFNQGAERVFGYQAAELDGQFLEVLLPERFAASHRGHVKGFGEAHGRPRLMGERQEISGRRKNGEEFAAEASIVRLEVEGSEIYTAVLRDISARVRAEERLRDAVQARSDMLGIVSHDLRNPANAVKMLARSIMEGEDHETLSPHVLERIKVIQQAAEQMDALIEDLLDVTRIDTGRLLVSTRPTDGHVLVVRCTESLRVLAEDAGVELRSEVPEQMPMLLVDADRTMQLFSNVIGNAIKFTPRGGCITVTTVSRDADVEVCVTDTGPGIANDQLPRIFDRFYQGTIQSRLGSRHGAGLGLPISKGIAEAQGGAITIESVEGTGTTVRFTLCQAPPR